MNDTREPKTTMEVALERLQQAEQELNSCLKEDAIQMAAMEVEKIQYIRHSKGWKAYLMFRAIKKRQLLHLTKDVLKRDIVSIKQSMLDVDWLKQTRQVLEERTRELIARAEPYQARIAEQHEAVEALINVAHQAGQDVYLFMAPYFTKERLADGYFQRVQAVDRMLPETSLKIYTSWLDADGLWKVPHVLIWDKTHIEIRYAHPHQENDKWILKIARCVEMVYHHSIAFANELVTMDPQVRKVFDMHGAYPEELRLYGRSEQAEIDERQEKLAMEHGQCMVCVTQSMADHLKQKYGRVPEKIILLPIFDEQRLKQCREQKRVSNGKTVVYAGGVQKWQNVEMMRNAAYQAKERMSYRFFTPQPQAFLKGWAYWRRPKNMEVCAKKPEEVIHAYASCDYGFLLRDDIVVNRVACPTKLVEYLACGIIPILKTDRIGDFVKDGMMYVSLEEFLAGRLPDEKEKQAAIKQNFQVVQKLETRYQQGRRELCSWIENK